MMELAKWWHYGRPLTVLRETETGLILDPSAFPFRKRVSKDEATNISNLKDYAEKWIELQTGIVTALSREARKTIDMLEEELSALNLLRDVRDALKKQNVTVPHKPRTDTPA